jgi:hypothetical protein
MASVFSKTIKARDLPRDWREEGRFAPDEEVRVIVRPAGGYENDSPTRFIGAGKGVFGSAKEIDAYLQRNRDAWQS